MRTKSFRNGVSFYRKYGTASMGCDALRFNMNSVDIGYIQKLMFGALAFGQRDSMLKSMSRVTSCNHV